LAVIRESKVQCKRRKKKGKKKKGGRQIKTSDSSRRHTCSKETLKPKERDLSLKN